MTESALFIVATPIGNLQDISPRAIDILKQVDLIACEDTRHTLRLLRHFGIDTPMQSLHDHNEERLVPELVGRLAAGERLALVSDAGTPLISDPGYRLVRAARDAGMRVLAVPGPSALIAALSVAGLPTDRFAFEGFPPSKAAARQRSFRELAREPRTLVFYESGHRILDCLRDMSEQFGDQRRAAVCRELTKQFESFYQGGLGELAQQLAADPNALKGEFVVVVAGHVTDEDTAMASAMQLASALADSVPASQAARIAARIHGVSRRALYGLLEKKQV